MMSSIKAILCGAVLIYFFTARILAQQTSTQLSTPIPKPTIEYVLAYPGILPDHILFPIKKLRDTLLIMFTQDYVKRTHMHLLFADKQMRMGQSLWEKEKYEMAGESFVQSQKNMVLSIHFLNLQSNAGTPPPGLVDKVELALRKHDEIMQEIRLNSAVNNSTLLFSEALEINHQAIQQIPSLK